MVDSPEPPKAPDPKETAAAQATMNKETAVAQYGLNATNQKTPYGSLSYAQIGTWADGTPRFEATTSLSPEQQSLYDLTSNTQKNLGQIGVDQSAKVGALLNTPLNINNEATEARLMELQQKRMSPVLDQRRKATEADLLNRGITMGSEAYNNSMDAIGRQENDQLNQLMLTGRAQAVQEALTERNQPLNEIIGLMNGSQVQQPGFQSTPTPGVAGVDYGGMVNSSYAGQMEAYKQESANQNAMMEGLFSLAAAPLGGWATGGFKGF